MTESELIKMIADYHKGTVSLKELLSQNPPEVWIKQLEFAEAEEPYKYLPIDKVEWLLHEIFNKHKIQITGQGTAFNSVWVTVRTNYLPMEGGEWLFHDGIGSIEVSRLSGSLTTGFPMAKTAAIKDGCDHLGKLFGADLNRKDAIEITSNKVDKGKQRKKSLKDGQKNGTVTKIEAMP